MTKTLRLSVFLLLGLLTGSISVAAQNGSPTAPLDRETPRPGAEDVRANALRGLGLSPEQVRQIRGLNQERRPVAQAAQRRHREAMRALDEAIYADRVDDALVESRIRELHAAQAEISRLRFAHEFAVRKVLTPEQLTRFREMRQRFEAGRDGMRPGTPPRDGMRPNLPPRDPAQMRPWMRRPKGQ